MGDRLDIHVKSSMLSTLNILISKSPLFLKAVAKPIQTTFLKSLHDVSSKQYVL